MEVQEVLDQFSGSTVVQLLNLTQGEIRMKVRKTFNAPFAGGSGAPASGVTLRQDLVESVAELTFEDLNIAGERVLPSIGMPRVSGYWPVLPREAISKVPDTARAPDGSYVRGTWEWNRDNYNCYEYGYEEVVDMVSSKEWAEWINQEEVSAGLAWQKLLLARESRIAAAVFNASVFTGANDTLGITNEWDDAASATPWADINNAFIKFRAKTGMSKRILSLIITEDNVDFVLQCNEVKQSVQYTEAVPTMARARKMQFLAEYFGIKELVEVMSLYDTAGLGADFSVGAFWSNEYGMLAYLSPATPSPKRLGLGSQPYWKEYATNYIMETYAIPSHNQEVIRAREHRGTKVNKDFGVLISNMKTTVESNGI